MSEEWRHWRLAPFFEHRWMTEQAHQIEQWTPAIDWLALMQAQEAVTQQRPWWNPFGIDWNIRPSGPDWSLSNRTERHVDDALETMETNAATDL